MGDITTHMIVDAYEAARKVTGGTITEAQAVEVLLDKHSMNPASAMIYIRNLPMMLEGKTLKRTMSAQSFEVFLERIFNDYDRATARLALSSVQGHVAYYSTLGRGRLNRVAAICNDMSKRLG